MSRFYNIVEKLCFISNELTPFSAKTLMSEAMSGGNKSDVPKSFYKQFCVKKSVFRGYPVYAVSPADLQERSSNAVLFLAGGNGTARPTKLHYDTVKALIDGTGSTVYIAMYPLAPRHNVRDALGWLEVIYAAMLKRHAPEKITFVGDSAGANLSLSLAGRVEVKPGRIITISPAAGLEDGEPRNIRKAMERSDPLLSVSLADKGKELWAKDVPLDSPDISPEYIDYAGFPPVFMLYGSHELFYPHVKRLEKQIRSAGAAVFTDEQPMCHDWALCGAFFPEGRRAWQEMCCFILNGTLE